MVPHGAHGHVLEPPFLHTQLGIAIVMFILGYVGLILILVACAVVGRLWRRAFPAGQVESESDDSDKTSPDVLHSTLSTPIPSSVVARGLVGRVSFRRLIGTALISLGSEVERGS